VAVILLTYFLASYVFCFAGKRMILILLTNCMFIDEDFWACPLAFFRFGLV